MNDTTRALLVILMLIVIFGLSYVAFDHIDNAYMNNEPQIIKELESANDSLKTLANELKEEKTSLQARVEELEETVSGGDDEINGGDEDE